MSSEKAKTKEDRKSDLEREVFKGFLKARGLPSDDVRIKNCQPPAPDILYDHPDLGMIAFELAENCSPNIAIANTESLKSGQPIYVRTADQLSDLLNRKQEKTYESEHPIELILYSNGRTVSPDDYILSLAAHLDDKGKFRKIWYFGKKDIYDLSSLMRHAS